MLGADLQVPPATAGLLLFAGGLVVGIGAPVLAGLTSRFDRRMLLAVTAAIYAVGHGLAALAPEFWSLLVIRTVTMVAAALFTPQAAATVGLAGAASKAIRGHRLYLHRLVAGLGGGHSAGKHIGHRVWLARHVLRHGRSLGCVLRWRPAVTHAGHAG